MKRQKNWQRRKSLKKGNCFKIEIISLKNLVNQLRNNDCLKIKTKRYNKKVPKQICKTKLQVNLQNKFQVNKFVKGKIQINTKIKDSANLELLTTGNFTFLWND